jgi:hypothetical protein
MHMNKTLAIGMIALVFVVGGTALQAASANQYTGFDNPVWGLCGGGNGQVSGQFYTYDGINYPSVEISWSASPSDSQSYFWWCNHPSFNNIVFSIQVSQSDGGSYVCTTGSGGGPYYSSSGSLNDGNITLQQSPGIPCSLSVGEWIHYTVTVNYQGGNNYQDITHSGSGWFKLTS